MGLGAWKGQLKGRTVTPGVSAAHGVADELLEEVVNLGEQRLYHVPCLQ